MDDTLGASLCLLTLFQAEEGNYALIANNLYDAEKIYNFLLNFLPEKNVVFFPADELLRAEAIASSQEMLSQRLYAMGRLRENDPKILVTHPAALLRYLPNPRRFDEETLHLHTGDSYDLPKLKVRLVEMGYRGEDKIDHSLEFASRGDILDIYSVSSLYPVRVEFFGDQIESIRTFDVRSQESKDKLSSCTILPATDIFLNDDELSDFASRAGEVLKKDKELQSPEVGDLLSQSLSADLSDFINHNYKNELYKYYGFALNEPWSILSYFESKLIYVCSKNVFEADVKTIEKEARDYYLDLLSKGKLISHLQQYMAPEQAFPHGVRTVASEAFRKKADDFSLSVRPIVMTGRGLSHIVPTISTYLSTGSKVVLSLKEKQQREIVLSLLKEANISYEEVEGFDLPKSNLGITQVPLNEGFDLQELKITYLSPSEIFGHKISSNRFTNRFKNATILKSYEELHPGDYVVHEYNGIGQFLGVKTIETDGIHRDYLQISYAGDETLYVPLEQFRLVRKYAGREGAVPKLSHLSSGDWEKKKAKIKAKVNELADRLMALYRSRSQNKGFAFPPDDELQAQFESEFPHELTPDQAKSLREIKDDMEKLEIMDRLLCGDVGFGKTEIAFRAAFKAISAGKQVAMLAPTTLLTKQHFEVATERFAGYGVHIAMFSRLTKDQEAKGILAGLKDGSIDFVIGTHRLLSKSVSFRDLGLLIVDEEQRFGVEQKERIKEMKGDVDVLTLSATPIPRTLQMSLVGVRALSSISTPPSGRTPIQTYVTPYSFSVVRDLIEREIRRHGQVFYIHNNIRTIYNIAAKIENAVPEAAVGVVHGQMDKEDSDDVMSRFYDGELNVLVATSIVENGIDVPNANLLIVEDADRFGLSQLYQIKGRVGRGDRIAYAYLMYRENKEMNEDAQKRLQAIQEFTDLGSGYKIAQRDLMIRGAGDMLGPEQAGFIDSIGLDLYLKMLNEAVEAKKTGKAVEPPRAKELLQVDAYIPKEYAENGDKIALYQELDAISDFGALKDFSKKIRDIYGKIPAETALLIQKKRIDLYCAYEEIEGISEGEDYVDILLSSSFTRYDGMGSDLFDSLIDYIDLLKVTFLNKKLKMRLKKRKDKWLNDLEDILKRTHALYAKRAGGEKSA